MPILFSDGSVYRIQSTHSGLGGGGASQYIGLVSADPAEFNEKLRAEYHARWEAVETIKAQELATMTEERALEIIQSLVAVEPWRERRDWSGLVEQQAIFHRAKKS